MPVLQTVAMVLTFFAGILMVSNIRYHSFKGINWREKVPFVTILMVVFILVSGPVFTLVQLRRRRAERILQKQQDSKNPGSDENETPKE